MKLPGIAALLIILLPVFLSIPFGAEPLARDQGYFAYGGWRILHGEFPYSDFWANTFPGVFGWYTLMNLFAVGGYLGHPLWNGLVIGIASFGILRLRGDYAGLWAGLGYGVLCTTLHRFWDIAQAEQLMNLFVIFALYFFWNRRLPFASGLLFGLAILTKPTAVLLFPLFVFQKRPGIGALLGGGLMAVCFLAVPYAVSGNSSDMFGDLIRFNALYGSSKWNLPLFRRIVGHFWEWLLPLLPIVVCSLPGLFHGMRRERVFYWWFILALLGIVIQAKLFSYHWITLLPPFALVFGSGIDGVLRGSKVRRAVACGVTIAAVLISFRPVVRTWYPAYHEAKLGLVHLCGGSSREEYLSAFGDKASGGDFSALAQHKVSAYVRDLPGQTLLVWGFEPGVNLLSGRPCPTKYIVDFPLTFLGRNEAAQRMRALHRKRFLFEIHANPPDVFVVAQDDQNPVEPEDSLTQLRFFPELRMFLDKLYQPMEAADTGYLVFLRRQL